MRDVDLHTLPDTWESWAPDAKERVVELLRASIDDKQAGRLAWLQCTRESCDGSPHDQLPKHARHTQRPPAGAWLVWLVLAGRGFGKTRTGAEWSWRQARVKRRGALIAPTAADARDTMVEGESGILACAPQAFRPLYEPSKRRLTYPNGARQTVFSADEPDRLRGPQHEYAWGDELAAWRYLEEAWAQLLLGLRIGQHPQACVTTTPRPIPLLRSLIVDERSAVVRGSTYDNLSNLAPSFREQVVARYEGTRLGRQELHAELLDDVEGALWSLVQLEALRAYGSALELAEQCARVVVAVDPAVTSGEHSDETGIIVAGISDRHHCVVCGPSTDSHALVLADLSGRYTPEGWASRAVSAYETFRADAVIAEVNNGGDMVGHVVRTVSSRARYRKVTASRGKRVRAEPIAALYEQGRVHHVGQLSALEDQMVTWTPDSLRSPDRMDAAVWALSDLLLTRRTGYASVA